MRFSGFDDEWIEDYLNKLFDNRNERNFESLEVLSVTINGGVLKRSDLGSDRKNKDKKSMKHVLKGDLVYNPMFMWKGASGISSYEGITSADYIVLKSKNNVNPIFFSHLFQTEKSLNKFKNYSQGSLLERLRLMYPQFSDIKMAFPSYEEQEKIANLLTFVDNKIELIEKKYQTYLDFKKYLMQQIFTQKLRFNFKEEWNQYKLKELLTVKSSGISINQMEENSGEYPLYGASGFIKNIDFCEMESDYISIVKDGSGVGNLSYHEKNSSIVNTSQYLLPKKNFDIHFLYYQLQTLNLLKYVNGSSIPHIYFKDYCIEKVAVPSLPEQQKIGKLFVDTDKTLENIKNSIHSTQEFKKGLLQQMFVVRINWRCNFKLAKSPSFNKHLLILKNKIIFIIIK